VQQTVIVQYTNVVGPTTYSIPNYNSNPDLLEIVQFVQGEFESVGTNLHVKKPGFDRLFAIGDLTHKDYQVTVTVTVHSLTPDGYDAPSNGPAIGLGMRWIGHTGTQQPRRDFWPAGAFCWYRWTTSGNAFQIRTNEYNHLQGQTLPFDFGVPYVFKTQVETLPGNIPQFRFRYWKASDAEPATWNLQVQGDAVDPQAGAVLLLAHECDATFGPMSVVPIGAGN
jgi:hypothetical protein